jgi:hypothetical protein
MSTAILIGLGIEAGIAAEVLAWIHGFGWRQRLAMWIVILATVLY